MANSENLRELAKLTDSLRKDCAYLGILVCKSKIPNWRILDLHRSFDLQRFCTHLDATSKLFEKNIPISIIFSSLSLKRDFLDFQQFKKDLASAVVNLSDHQVQVLRVRLGLIDDSLLLYICKLIGLLKLSQLHKNKIIMNWITDFEHKHPGLKKSLVPVITLHDSPIKKRKSDPLEELSSKKLKVCKKESPAGKKETCSSPCVQPTQSKVSAVGFDEKSQNDCCDEIVKTDENYNCKWGKYISRQAGELKAECESIYNVLSDSREIEEHPSELSTLTKSWKPQAFLKWLGYVDTGLFEAKVLVTPDSLQNLKMKFERLSTRVNSINVCHHHKNRIHTFCANLVTSLNEMTVKLMIISYQKLSR